MDAKYLKALRDPVTNKITRIIPEILAHLFNTYGHVTPSELYDLKQKVETMQFTQQEPVDTMITEVDDLADIAELASSPITDRQRVDMGYIILQCCKPFKTCLREWKGRPLVDCTWDNFKTHVREAQIALRKTGKITIDEGLNHTNIVNMVTEGVRAALADQKITEEVVNNTNETENLRQQLLEIKQLVKQMNVAQQSNQQTQPPMTQPTFTPQYQYGQGQQYYTPYLVTNGTFPPQSYPRI